MNSLPAPSTRKENSTNMNSSAPLLLRMLPSTKKTAGRPEKTKAAEVWIVAKLALVVVAAGALF
jgi:hypothetical protein